jgi:hypothetical protein
MDFVFRNPNHILLIVGCSDGVIHVFYHNKTKNYDNYHHKQISCIEWDVSGTKVLTGDTVRLFILFNCIIGGRYFCMDDG